MTLKADDPLTPRHTDPSTSCFKGKVLSQREQVLVCAEVLYEFSDTELRDQYEDRFDTRIDRGMIARVRLALERLGKLERLPIGEHDSEVKFRVR